MTILDNCIGALISSSNNLVIPLYRESSCASNVNQYNGNSRPLIRCAEGDCTTSTTQISTTPDIHHIVCKIGYFRCGGYHILYRVWWMSYNQGALYITNHTPLLVPGATNFLLFAQSPVHPKHYSITHKTTQNILVS